MTPLLTIMGVPLSATMADRAREEREVRPSLNGSVTARLDYPRDRWSLSLAAVPLSLARALRALCEGARWDFSRSDYGSNQTTWTGVDVYVSGGRLTVPSTATATLTADLSAPWAIAIDRDDARTVVLSTGEAFASGAAVPIPTWFSSTTASFSVGPGQYLGFVAFARVSPDGARELSRSKGRPGLEGAAVTVGDWSGQADVEITGMELNLSGRALLELELLQVPDGIGGGL